MITRFAFVASRFALSLCSDARPAVGRSLLTLSLVLCATALQAEPIARELGEDLRYFRAHLLPADLPAADVKPSPVILDLRYTKAEPNAATALDAWLKFRATPKTPVVILLNSETDRALLDVLIPATKRSDLVTVGRKFNENAPDIVIESTADDERRAYDALEHDTSVEALITENADKPRVDEASIMRDRADGIDRAFAPENRPTGDKKIDPPTPAPTDRALQRAIHLHRALLALRRLPD